MRVVSTIIGTEDVPLKLTHAYGHLLDASNRGTVLQNLTGITYPAIEIPLFEQASFMYPFYVQDGMRPGSQLAVEIFARIQTPSQNFSVVAFNGTITVQSGSSSNSSLDIVWALGGILAFSIVSYILVWVIILDHEFPLSLSFENSASSILNSGSDSNNTKNTISDDWGHGIQLNKKPKKNKKNK